jgi:hypothetical protein
MLFGIWPRMGWSAGWEKQSKLWKFFDAFEIEKAEMIGFWEPDAVLVDRPETYATVFAHPKNGVLAAIATWHAGFADWQGISLDTSIALDRTRLGLPEGKLVTTDIFTGEEIDIEKTVPLPDAKAGRLIWIRSPMLDKTSYA